METATEQPKVDEPKQVTLSPADALKAVMVSMLNQRNLLVTINGVEGMRCRELSIAITHADESMLWQKWKLEQIEAAMKTEPSADDMGTATPPKKVEIIKP